MDDVSVVTIALNDISGSFIGLRAQTNGEDIHDNTVHESCISAYVDPDADGAKIHDNTFGNTAPGCPVGFTSDIRIAGGIDTVVKNKISNVKTVWTAEAVYYVLGTGDVASGNVVKDNTCTGKENAVKNNNECAKSIPATLCT